jgi:hypothetical protein
MRSGRAGMHLPVAIKVPACRASDPLKKKWWFLLFPVSSVTGALRASSFCSFCAAGHLDTLAVDERIGDLAPGLMQVAPRGLAGDPEFLCRLFLFKAFKVDEPDKLDFVGLEWDPLAPFFRATAGFVTSGFWRAVDSSPEARSSPSWARDLPVAVARQLLLLPFQYKILNDLTFAWNLQKGLGVTYCGDFSGIRDAFWTRYLFTDR